jgi:membrane protease YdiL (CAAX protease family)
VTNPFFNAPERRLRALWRLLLQIVLFVTITLIIGWLTLGVFSLIGGETEVATESSIAFAAFAVISLVAAIISVWLAARFFDRRPLSGLGLRLDRNWWLDLGFGLSLGALLMTAIFLVELSAGWVTVTGAFEAVGGGPFFPAVLAPLVIFLVVGVYEELIYRGYQLTNLAEGLNYPGLGGPKGAVVLALVISSSIFGLGHFLNPNATIVSTANIAFAGLVLGLGYVLTGRLAVGIGFHITWNFFQNTVFGFPVSGIEPIGATFISIEQSGPHVFTGDIFGPEAGLIGLFAMVAGGLLIAFWARIRSGKTAIETSLAEPPTVATEYVVTPNTEGY